MKKLVTICAVVIFVMAMPAGATTINYTVSGWGPTQYPGPVTPPEGSPHGPSGYPGDTVELVTYTGTLDLTPGTYDLKINTLLWSVDFTYAGTDTQWDYPDHWSDLSFNINAGRGMSIGTAADFLSQNGLLGVTWFYDRLSFSQGTVTSFVVDGYRVDVTPLEVASTDAGGTVGPPWVQPSQDVMARFDVTVVPEPATMCLLGFGALSLIRRKRRA
ncbi:MAG: PEP-CTERM sorting domain-containing protein [Sedimentisphaerales bacterium]